MLIGFLRYTVLESVSVYICVKVTVYRDAGMYACGDACVGICIYTCMYLFFMTYVLAICNTALASSPPANGIM